MAITFNETTRIFTLTTAHTTYQMQADAQGYLLHLYYGARTAGEMDYLLNYGDRGFSGNPNSAAQAGLSGRLPGSRRPWRCRSRRPSGQAHR